MSAKVILILFAAVLLIGLVALYAYGEHKGDDVNRYFPVSIVSMLLGIVIIVLVDTDRPKPIDVYRGNTTLKITYVNDSVPVDSVVVFKKDYQKCKN